MHEHLIAVNRLQHQLGFSVTTREATAFIIIAIFAIVIGVIKTLILS